MAARRSSSSGRGGSPLAGQSDQRQLEALNRASQRQLDAFGETEFGYIDFSAGYINRRLWHRSDADFHKSGLAEARNVLVRKEGPVRKRPGTRFIDRIDTLWTLDNFDWDEIPFVIPFVFSDDESYALVFYRRFIAIAKNYGGSGVDEDARFVSAPTANVLGVTNANPGVVSVDFHDFRHLQDVYITGVPGMTEINDKWYTVDLTKTDATRQDVHKINGPSNDNICIDVTCRTAAVSGLAPGDFVYFEPGAGPDTDIDANVTSDFDMLVGPVWEVEAVDAANFRFTIKGLHFPTWPELVFGTPGTLYVQKVDTTQFRLYDGSNPVDTGLWGVAGVGGTVDGRYEVATFIQNRVREMQKSQWVQSADILTIANSTFHPYDVSRIAEQDWKLSPTPFEKKMRRPNFVNAQAETPGQTYRYAYRVTFVDEDGNESLAHEDWADTQNPLGVSPNRISVTTAATDPSRYAGSDQAVAKIRVYFFDGATQSWIPVYWQNAPVYPALFTWQDDGTGTTRVPFEDYEELPPRFGFVYGRPSNAQVPNGPATNFERKARWPRGITYAWQRLWLAGSNEERRRVYASAVGDTANFNPSDASLADEAFWFDVSDQKEDDCLYLVNLKELMLLTSGAQHRLASSVADFTSPVPGGVKSEPQRRDSVAAIAPIVVDDTMIYLTDANAVRELRYEADALAGAAYGGRELSVLADDLLRNKDVRSIAWSKRPDNLLWLATSSRDAIAVTYSREHDSIAFSTFDSHGDEIGSVSSVPESGLPATYFAIRRLFNGVSSWSFERMTADRSGQDPTRETMVDCHVVLETPKQPVGSYFVSGSELRLSFSGGHTAINGDLVDVRGAGQFDEDGDFFELDPINSRFKIDLVAGSTYRMLHPESGDVVDAAVLAVSGSFVAEDGVASSLDVRVPSQTFDIGNRAHLDGESIGSNGVAGLANGGVLAEGSVSGRTFTTTEPPLSIGVIGWRYKSRAVTLPLFDRSKGAHTRHKKRSAIASLGVNRTRGLRFGVVNAPSEPIVERTTEDWYRPTLLASGEVEIVIEGIWQRWIQFVMESSEPLPWEVEAITAEVWFGEP